MRVLIHKGKHYDRVYDASDNTKVARALASIMLEDAPYIERYKPSVPRKPESLKVDIPVGAGPGQVEAIVAKVAKENKRYEAAMQSYQEDMMVYEEFRGLVEQGIDALAPRARYFWGYFFDGGEYNTYEIERVEQP